MLSKIAKRLLLQQSRRFIRRGLKQWRLDSHAWCSPASQAALTDDPPRHSRLTLPPAPPTQCPINPPQGQTGCTSLCVEYAQTAAQLSLFLPVLRTNLPVAVFRYSFSTQHLIMCIKSVWIVRIYIYQIKETFSNSVSLRECEVIISSVGIQG